MSDNRIHGEFDTIDVKRHWIASRADGRRALIFELRDGRVLALELPDEVVSGLAADLAKLSAQIAPPNKPNA